MRKPRTPLRSVSSDLGAQQARRKKKGDPFYTSGRWVRFRRAILKRDNYTCQECGKVKGSSGGLHVDHMISRAQRPDLTFVAGNVTTLCHSCHSRKTAFRDGGFGNSKRPMPSGCDEGGVPLDPEHPWNK